MQMVGRDFPRLPDGAQACRVNGRSVGAQGVANTAVAAQDQQGYGCHIGLLISL